VNPAVIHFPPHVIPRYFVLEGFRSNGVQTCWLNLTAKKICFQESFSVFPGRSRYRRARCRLDPGRALAGNRNFEKRAREERTQKQQQQDRITLEQMGGKELAIQNFYATPERFAVAKLSGFATASPTPSRQARTSVQSRVALLFPLCRRNSH